MFVFRTFLCMLNKVQKEPLARSKKINPQAYTYECSKFRPKTYLSTNLIDSWFYVFIELLECEFLFFHIAVFIGLLKT